MYNCFDFIWIDRHQNVVFSFPNSLLRSTDQYRMGQTLFGGTHFLNNICQRWYPALSFPPTFLVSFTIDNPSLFFPSRHTTHISLIETAISPFNFSDYVSYLDCVKMPRSGRSERIDIKLIKLVFIFDMDQIEGMRSKREGGKRAGRGCRGTMHGNDYGIFFFFWSSHVI